MNHDDAWEDEVRAIARDPQRLTAGAGWRVALLGALPAALATARAFGWAFVEGRLAAEAPLPRGAAWIP